MHGCIPPFNLHMNACKIDLWFSVRKKGELLITKEEQRRQIYYDERCPQKTLES